MTAVTKQRVAKPKTKPRRVREGAAEPRWLTRGQLEAIHQEQLREHGGSPGVRDEGLLQSAMNRARNTFVYGKTDLAVMAAAHAFRIAKNHAFVDGNKRTAFQAMYLFLGLNAHDLDAPEPEVVDTMNRLAAGKLTEAAFAGWLGEHTRPSRA